MVMRHHVGAGNKTQVLWMSNKCSYLLSQLPRPLPTGCPQGGTQRQLWFLFTSVLFVDWSGDQVLLYSLGQLEFAVLLPQPAVTESVGSTRICCKDRFRQWASVGSASSYIILVFIILFLFVCLFVF